MSLIGKIKRLEEVPPFLVWAIAHRGNVRPTLNEFAEISGMSLRTFTRIARRNSWKSVKLGQIIAFCEACNVDPTPEHVKRYMRDRKKPFPSLTPHQRTMLDKQCAEWELAKAEP